MPIDAELDAILARWDSHREAGEPIAIEDLCRESPARLDEVVLLLRKLEGLDDFLGADPEADTEPDPDAPGAEHTLPKGVSTQLRCQALRFHARGGLGEVFVAWDEGLGREVALKLIQHRHDHSPDRRERFVREAEITGRLGHPGIVPVFGLGTTDDGRPCYAMRFIEGETLQAAIARLHAAGTTYDALAFRGLLSRLIAVCHAVAFAHSRGVIHRDIKPANVMLGPFQETLVVDWGLAKRDRDDAYTQTGGPVPADPSGNSGPEDDLTRFGATLGTPAYMSPEQAEGRWDAVGPSSDIYSLGATLYSLLIGRPAFENRDRRALLEQVRAGDFPAPRQVNPTVPAALEAVCLKAMSMLPVDRYRSASGLAADLERWLADEPVSAWREPATVRIGRWARRNRTVVTAVAVAMLAALAGTAVVLAVQTRANSQLKVSNNALLASNDRERARFALALDAIGVFHGEVSTDFLLKEKPFKPLRTKLLGGAAEFYGKLEGLLAKDEDPSSRAALGRAYIELAELTAKIGDRPKALAVHRKSLALRRELAARPGADAEAKLDVARSLLSVGVAQGETGDHAGAMATLREANAAAEALVGGVGASDSSRYVQARCQLGIGSELRHIGKPDAALAAYQRARAIHRALADAHPDRPKYRSEEASETLNIGLIYLETGKVSEALADLRHARLIFGRLADADPSNFETRQRLAITCNDLGAILSDIGLHAESKASYEQARAIHQALADANPNVASFQLSLAYPTDNLGWLAQMTGEHREALARHRRSVEIVQKLADTNPADPEVQDLLATCRMGLGDANRHLGHLAEAAEEYDRALTIHEVRVKARPANAFYRWRLAENVWRRGLMRLNAGQDDAAGGDFRQAVALFEVAPTPTQNWDMNQMAYAYASLAGLADHGGAGPATAKGRAAADRAMHLLRNLVSAGYRYPREMEGEVALDPLRARPDFQLLMKDLVFPTDPFAHPRFPKNTQNHAPLAR